MEETTPKKSFLSNKAYVVLKAVAAILPLIGAFYYGLSEIWGLPYGGPIQATFALIASTLSAILIKLSHDYSKYQQAISQNVLDVPVENIEETPVEEQTEVEAEPSVENTEETNDEEDVIIE